MNKICGYSCEHNKGGVCQIINCYKKIMMTTTTEPQVFTRWQDPTINDLIKENLELKRKLGEADDAVEYWQIECDKRSKVLDKIKEYIENTDDFDIEIFDENSGGCLGTDLSKGAKHILELLEEIE